MKGKEIKVGHIYYVDYEPVRKGEFGKFHLAVVLKKNLDRITFVTIPLTSKECGIGINKVDLGRLDCLPSNLQSEHSYAVYDQVRTVSADRFRALKQNGAAIEAELPEEKFSLIFECILKDLMYDLKNEEKESICKKLCKEYEKISNGSLNE